MEVIHHFLNPAEGGKPGEDSVKVRRLMEVDLGRLTHVSDVAFKRSQGAGSGCLEKALEEGTKWRVGLITSNRAIG